MPEKKRRRPILIEFGQGCVRWFFRIVLTLFYRVRVHGLENYPEQDGFLLCANHQSFLDPVVLGVVCPRPVNYLGRKTLFSFGPLGWFLTWNDTIPIDREGSGLAGIKETIRRLRRGESVVMFPEGTRTDDGEFQPLKLGFCALARRSKAALLPVGFDGPYQAFPRQRLLPQTGRVQVVIGKPIVFEDYEDLSDQEMADLLESRMRNCFEKAHRLWENSALKTA